MNPASLNNLIDSIRSLLDGRPSSVSAEVVAHEYASQCQEVNARLGGISPMLDGGGEIQALQVAEQPPRVLDLAIALSFGGEVEWQEFCRDHGHEVAPMIDARTLEALLAIQEKGVSSNHPLYRDYRSAVSSKNDAKSYELIRIITRLNPGDENAARELKRLERKSIQAALAEIRAALAANMNQEVLALMPRVEQAGSPETYENLAEWKEAVSIRQGQRREDARMRMPALLGMAEQQMQTGNWRHAAVSLGEFMLLFETYGTSNQASGMIERANAIDGLLTKHRSEAERAGRVNQLVAEMSHIADEVEIRAVTPVGLDPEFASPLLEGLVRNWRQVEDLRGGIPAGPRARIEATRAQLEQAIERARSAHRNRIIGGAVVGTLLLLIVAGVGMLALRASGHAKMLADLQAKKSTSSLRDLLHQVNDKEALLLRFSSLSSAAANASRWLDAADAEANLVDLELKRLEQAREGDFTEIDSPVLHERLREAGTLVSKLPDDMRNAADTRLSLMKNEGERIMQKRQEISDGLARAEIAHWTAVLGAVDYKASASTTKEAIKGTETRFAPFLELAKHQVPMLRLPASTESGIQNADSRLRKVRGQVEAVESAVATLEGAQTPGAYRVALETLAGCSFKEADQAQTVLDAWPKDNRVKAFLIFRNDMAALKAAENAPSTNIPFPEAATKLDREVIEELSKSDTLNGLWELEWKLSKGSPQKGLSKGELKRHDLTTWSGKAANYPARASSPLKFIDVRFNLNNDFTVTLNRMTPVSAMMESLQISKLLDDTGTEYRSSILPLIDRVSNAKGASPLARAYVLAKLYRLIRGRETQWGLHYCPEVISDLEAFSEYELKWPVIENSWLLEEKPACLKPWEDYFRTKDNRSFYDNMKDMKSAADAGIKKPIILAGRVAKDGTVELSPARMSRILIGIGVVNPGERGLRLAGIVQANATSITPSPSLVPFSPLLSIEMPASDQIFLNSIHALPTSAGATTGHP